MDHGNGYTTIWMLPNCIFRNAQNGKLYVVHILTQQQQTLNSPISKSLIDKRSCVAHS